MVLVNAGLIVQSQWPVPVEQPRPPTDTVTVASLNLYVRNLQENAVLEEIRRLGPDIVVCVEVTPAWANALRQLQDEYRFQEFAPRDHAFGMAVLSRRPISTSQFNLPDPEAGC